MIIILTMPDILRAAGAKILESMHLFMRFSIKNSQQNTREIPKISPAALKKLRPPTRVLKKFAPPTPPPHPPVGARRLYPDLGTSGAKFLRPYGLQLN